MKLLANYFEVFNLTRSKGLTATMYKNILTIIGIILCTSCSSDDANFVDPEFEAYVAMFFEEAQKRNIEIIREDISFSVVFGNGYSTGACNLDRNRIIINKSYWNTLTELTRQYLIFHELGHCVLDRLHDNNVLPNGECKSIMKGNEENECRLNIDNFEVWRDYYLDELFNENTSLPAWYTSTINITPSQILYEIRDSLAQSIDTNLENIDPNENILIEAIYNDWNKQDRAWLLLDNERIACFNKAITISNLSNALRYFKENVNFKEKTKINFIRKDGFFYYLVDDKMIHIENQLDTPLSIIKVQLAPGTSTNISEANLSLKVSLLE